MRCAAFVLFFIASLIVSSCSGNTTKSADFYSRGNVAVVAVNNPSPGMQVAPGEVVPIHFVVDYLPGVTGGQPLFLPTVTVSASAGEVAFLRENEFFPGYTNIADFVQGQEASGFARGLGGEVGDFWWIAPETAQDVVICVSTAGNELSKKSVYRRTVTVEVR